MNEPPPGDAPRPALLRMPARSTYREKVAADSQALEDSGLYAAHGGVTQFAGVPSNAVEGWPAGINAVLARFPSRAAAEAFWFSAKYQQDIKPLRRGAGTFQAAIFDAV